MAALRRFPPLLARWLALALTLLIAVSIVAACAPSFSQVWERTDPSPSAPLTDWTGCLSRSSVIVARVSPTRVRFCGRITDAAVDALRRALADGDRTLEITSLGGELDAPIDLAEIVFQRRLDVEVIGPCLSGCASYVFVAGTNRRVRQHGWLGLHNTNSSALFLAMRASGGQLDARDAPLRERAERERALYGEIRVRAELLLDPQARIGTECIVAGSRNGVTRETEYRIVSRTGFWVPTRGQWYSYGVYFEGYLPGSAREVVRVARLTLPSGARGSITIEHSAEYLPESAEAMLASVGWCGTRSP